MSSEDDDVVEVSSPGQLPATSQEESTTIPPSTPHTSSTLRSNSTPRRSKRLNSPEIDTPRRSKRLRKEAADSVTCSAVSAIEDDEYSKEFAGKSPEERLVLIKFEKRFVKLVKRKIKKGPSSPVWTFDYFRVAHLIDGWKKKKISKYSFIWVFLIFITNQFLFDKISTNLQV
jgi:hypothetical protein